MTYGSNENNEATLTLSPEEHERFKAGEEIIKRTGDSKGEITIRLQMIRHAVKVKLRLTNSIAGWRIMPIENSQEENDLLDILYGCDYRKMKPSHLAFMRNMPVGAAVLHIKNCCKDKLGVSFTGNEKLPDLYMWKL